MLQLAAKTNFRDVNSVFVSQFIETVTYPQETLLVLSGGSVVQRYQEALPFLKDKCLSHLFVTIVDERYGPLGHPDSNWEQIADTGFFEHLKNRGAQTCPILDGEDLLTTAHQWEVQLHSLMRRVKRVVAIMGVGPDGHTAGILPLTDAKVFQETFLDPASLSIAYRLDADRVARLPNPYRERITLSPRFMVTFLDIALVYATGENKQDALKKLLHQQGTIAQTPARLLHKCESKLFTDVDLDY